MQLLQAEIMVRLWNCINAIVIWLQLGYCRLRGKDIWESPIWDWYLINIAAEAYYHETKLAYTRDGMWPPVAEGV